MSSKFLRVMALSKTPADFRKKDPPEDASATVDKLSTVDKLTTVDKLAMDTEGNAVDARCCKPATLVQHGHTSGEHAVYMALWNAGGPSDRKDTYRDVTIGYDKLAAQAGGSKRNIQRLVEILKRKLAIEVLREEDSGRRQGKTYRVYGMSEILRRRREAGYIWSFRNRSAVELVKTSTVDKLTTMDRLSTVDNLTTVDKLTTDTVDKLTTDTVDKLTTPFRNSFRNKNEETSSSDATVLATHLARLGIPLDDDVAKRIIARCQNTDGAATVEEIAHFAELKVQQLSKRKNVENWPGMLMAAVPAYFNSPATELSRYRAEKRQELQNQQRVAREILADPDATDADRDWARSVCIA